MKSILVLLSFLVILCTSSSAQNRKVLPGTKLSIVPPENFVPGTNFTGFQQISTNSFIMVTIIPGPYNKIREGATADRMKTTGVVVTDIHDTTFNNYKAVLVKGTQYVHGATFAKEILMFGDADKTIMVASACPETDKAMIALLKKSTFSVQYDENQQAKPEDAVAFSIDTTGTNFILEPNMNGILSYKLKGESIKADVMLMVAGSFSTVIAADKKAYTLTRLKKLPGHENDKIISCVPVKIDGLPGYEVVATKQLAGKAVNEKILLVMLYSTENGYYYMIAGIAKKDVEKHMDTFKKMSRTFKRKKT